MGVMLRAKWGAGASHAPMMTIGAVRWIVVHYVGGGSAPIGEDAERRVVQSIARDHRARGWSDIAYSWLVGQSGTVWEGRGWERADGATRGLGGQSWSICWLGSLEQPSEAALDAIDWLVAEGRRRAGRPVPVIGHRDSPAHPGETACPGDALSAVIASGRWDPTQEVMVEKKVLLRDKDGGIWLCWGILRHRVPSMEQVRLLRFLGVEDQTDRDGSAIIETLAEVR
jgi:hypothetical protein